MAAGTTPTTTATGSWRATTEGRGRTSPLATCRTRSSSCRTATITCPRGWSAAATGTTATDTTSTAATITAATGTRSTATITTAMVTARATTSTTEQRESRAAHG